MGKCKDCVAGLFGVCRGDFCYTERVGLVERAQRAAGQLGHKLGDFTKIKEQPVWQSECKRCALRVSITVDPELGEPALWGEALSASCPVPETPSSEATHSEGAAE